MYPLWKKAAAVGVLSFLALWVVGTLRAGTLPYPEPAPWPLTLGEGQGAQGFQANANNLRALGLATKPLPLVLDQPEVERIRVHDRTAQLAVGTAAFDEDAARI